MREAGKRCRRQRIQCLLRGLPAVCPSRAYASPGFAGGPDFAACWKRKTPRHGRGGVFCRACTRLCSSLLQAPNAEASFYGKSLSFQHLQSQAPPRLRRGICVSSERASCRQASQEALKKSAACITCPAARKRAPFIQDYLSGNRKVVHLFPLRSMLEAKAFLLSPADQGVVISLKHTKQAGRGGNSSQHPRAACGRKKGSCASKEYLS